MHQPPGLRFIRDYVRTKRYRLSRMPYGKGIPVPESKEDEWHC